MLAVFLVVVEKILEVEISEALVVEGCLEVEVETAVAMVVETEEGTGADAVAVEDVEDKPHCNMLQ